MRDDLLLTGVCPFDLGERRLPSVSWPLDADKPMFIILNPRRQAVILLASSLRAHDSVVLGPRSLVAELARLSLDH